MTETVSIMYHPSPSQRTLWWHLVIEDDGVDQDGYWFGWCPLHGEARDPEQPTAQFNFRKGVMRCLGEPSCHAGQRVMSLTNVAIAKMGKDS